MSDRNIQERVEYTQPQRETAYAMLDRKLRSMPDYPELSGALECLYAPSQAAQADLNAEYTRGRSDGWEAAKASKAEQAEAPSDMGSFGHRCLAVTGHRGGVFVCQSAGHAVSQNSYCRDCTCPAATHPTASNAGEREAHARMIADFPALSLFHTKHALGPMTAPSCLCCGQLPESIAIKHAELPGIVICTKCRDAALASNPPAEEQKPVEGGANYTLTIVADSGYEATTEGRCTAEQYGAAIGALHGVVAQPEQVAQDSPLTTSQLASACMAFIRKQGGGNV